MFQQSATPEDLAAAHPVPAPSVPAPSVPAPSVPAPSVPAPSVPAAAVQSPAEGGAAARDPFIDHYFKRIDPRVAGSFSPEQCEAIKAMFGARGMARHTLEIRRSLPIGRGRYYLVLLLGRERRTFERLYSEGAISGGSDLLGYAITAALWMLPAAGIALLLQILL